MYDIDLNKSKGLMTSRESTQKSDYKSVSK